MRRVVAILLWWAVLLGLWQLYVGQTTTQTTIAGAIAAALAVGFAALLAHLGLYRFGLEDRRRLARTAAALPWRIVRDFALVARALLRGRPSGRLVELDFPGGSAGDRALAGLLGSIAPNAYVVDFDRESGSALVHELDPKRPRGAPL